MTTGGESRLGWINYHSEKKVVEEEEFINVRLHSLIYIKTLLQFHKTKSYISSHPDRQSHLFFISAFVLLLLYPMEGLMGLLRIRVKRGINLAIRDVRSSDPYVVIRMGKQKLKTRVISKDINPLWNEDLTLSVADPKLPIKLTVYDHDTFTKDDKMGEAEFDIRTYLEALKMELTGLPSGTIISRIQPNRNNCLSDESCIMWNEGKVVQDMMLRLRNVECGEVEIQLQWINVPGSRGIEWY